jgi:hypothetical protein
MQRHAKVLRLLCSIVVVGLLVLSLSACFSLGGGFGSGGTSTLTICNNTGATLTVLAVYKDFTEGALDNAENLLTSPLANGSVVTVTLDSTGAWIVGAVDIYRNVYAFDFIINAANDYSVAIDSSDFIGNPDD